MPPYTVLLFCALSAPPIDDVIAEMEKNIALVKTIQMEYSGTAKSDTRHLRTNSPSDWHYPARGVVTLDRTHRYARTECHRTYFIRGTETPFHELIIYTFNGKCQLGLRHASGSWTADRQHEDVSEHSSPDSYAGNLPFRRSHFYMIEEIKKNRSQLTVKQNESLITLASESRSSSASYVIDASKSYSIMRHSSSWKENENATVTFSNEYLASNFRLVDDTIWLPHQLNISNTQTTAAKSLSDSYAIEIHRSTINKLWPKSYFEDSIPDGVLVYDPNAKSSDPHKRIKVQ